MDLKTLQNILLKTIEENDLDLFFAKTQQLTTEVSELRGIILLLANRARKLKMETLKETISHENRTLEHNKIVDKLIEVVGLFTGEDLKKETVEKSVHSLLADIDFRKKEFQNIIDDKSKKIIRIGNDLIDLGGVLREKPSPDDKIPYAQKIIIGTQKGVRRIKIGFLELVELKNSMLHGIQKIHQAYSGLVTYLDFPKDEIGTDQLKGIKSATSSLEIFMQKFNPEQEPEIAQIAKAKSMFDQLFKFKDQLGSDFENYFKAIKEVLPKFDETLTFLVANQNELKNTKDQLQTTLTELQINIKEKEI